MHRSLPGLTGFGLLIMALLGCGQKISPNVLLITIDTTRADYIGCYGMSDVQTPHMDQLAAEGTLFMHNVAPSQCTNPSHASVLTGLYLARHTVYDNETPMPDTAVSLAEVLQSEGYVTLAAVSARHLNPINSNFSQGFDTLLTCEPVELKAGERNETFLPELRRVAAQPPFFAWVHYFDPHGPYAPPAPYDTLYAPADQFDPMPPRKTMEIGADKHREIIDPDDYVALYKGEISYLDSEIGRILALLDELELTEDTIVVLVADHGESMTEKDIFFCHAGMYNQVLHVPLIMRWPGRIPPGHRVRSVTSLVDIYPTLLSLASLSASSATSDLSGHDLTPTFKNPAAEIHSAVFSEAARGAIRAVYAQGYKYAQPYPVDWALKEPVLYRTFADYWEEQDLKVNESDRTREMTALLAGWLEAAQSRALPASEDHVLDAKTKEALKSLGYID
jgi:arylsulfatase A-like enzyme